MPAATYASCSATSREHAIEQLAALTCATTAEMLDLIVVADHAEDWRVDGAIDMASWLVASLNVSSGTAREWVRVGRALESLPHLRWRKDHDLDGYRYSGFLPAVEGELVNACLERRATQVGKDPVTEVWAPHDQRAADAFVDMARQELTVDPGPDPTVVVVHVDAETLDGDDGNGSVNGVQVASDTVRRLLCDAKIECNVEGPDGTCIGIGRIDRNPPRWLRRRIQHRDRHRCRFPGCDRRIRQIHHIEWWERDHGVTDSWNLVGLCWQHHHLVHEGGWTISGSADHRLTFTSPLGRVLTSGPAP